jgi:hypothetical protein
MSPATATAKDLARCSFRGCGSLKRTSLLAWHGRRRLIGPRSAAIGQAAAAYGTRAQVIPAVLCRENAVQPSGWRRTSPPAPPLSRVAVTITERDL